MELYFSRLPISSEIVHMHRINMWKYSKESLTIPFFIMCFSFVFCDINFKNLEDMKKGDVGDYNIIPQIEFDDVNETFDIRSSNMPAKKTYQSLEKGKNDKICPKYKNGEDIDLEKMTDVWQAVYYELPENLLCFKIHIRRTTESDRKEYLQKYGNFGNSVDWRNCLLEIKGAANEEEGRRHFLMGSNSTNGVFENLIIIEKRQDAPGDLLSGKVVFKNKASHYFRSQENSDQWKVVKDLLLMRDCDEGHIVVFSRFPRQHRPEEIFHALMLFGETTMEGKMACEKNHI